MDQSGVGESGFALVSGRRAPANAAPAKYDTDGGYATRVRTAFAGNHARYGRLAPREAGARPQHSAASGLLRSLEQRLLGDVSPASVGYSSSGKIACMVSGRIHARWAVRLSIARRGGWRSWLEVSGDFERGLEALREQDRGCRT